MNKVYCMFEQSGVFKKSFITLGYKALDIDIENNFGETDIKIDLFDEINKAYDNKSSIFDMINNNDLIIAFFPCTYFSGQNELFWSKKFRWFKYWDDDKINKYITDRKEKRSKMFTLFGKFIEVIKRLKIPCIIENPYINNYLLDYYTPDLVINDRSIYGDNHKKPTMFYSLNFKFKNNNIDLPEVKRDIIKHNSVNGHIRSMMHEDFAMNFIKRFII